MNVTNTTELLKELLRIDNQELENLAAEAGAGAAGLIFLPFIDGERVPALPEASGVFFGLNRQNFSRRHLARAVMEGTVLNLGYGFSRMKDLGLRPSEIRATGGGARSRTWLQVVADVLEAPVVTLKEPESAAYGAALQAIWCLRRQGEPGLKISDLAKDLVQKDSLAVCPDQKIQSFTANCRPGSTLSGRNSPLNSQSSADWSGKDFNACEDPCALFSGPASVFLPSTIASAVL